MEHRRTFFIPNYFYVSVRVLTVNRKQSNYAIFITGKETLPGTLRKCSLSTGVSETIRSFRAASAVGRGIQFCNIPLTALITI